MESGINYVGRLISRFAYKSKRRGYPKEEARMKAPQAILFGLSLIAAAIFFKDTTTPPAHAFGRPDGFSSLKLKKLLAEITIIYYHKGLARY